MFNIIIPGVWSFGLGFKCNENVFRTAFYPNRVMRWIGSGSVPVRQEIHGRFYCVSDKDSEKFELVLGV